MLPQGVPILKSRSDDVQLLEHDADFEIVQYAKCKWGDVSKFCLITSYSLSTLRFL